MINQTKMYGLSSFNRDSAYKTKTDWNDSCKMQDNSVNAINQIAFATQIADI